MIFYICYYYWLDSEGIIGSGRICHSFANLVLLLINNNMLMIDTLSMKSHSWRLFMNNVGISLVNRNWLDIILDQSLWRKLLISYKNIVKGYIFCEGKDTTSILGAFCFVFQITVLLLPNKIKLTVPRLLSFIYSTGITCCVTTKTLDALHHYQ